MLRETVMSKAHGVRSAESVRTDRSLNEALEEAAYGHENITIRLLAG